MIQELFWLGYRATRSLRHKQDKVRRDVLAWQRFWRSYSQYRKLAPPDGQPAVRYLDPCLGDDTEHTSIEPIYFYQDSWAFEKIVQQRPLTHVDVGSHHKFVALLSKVVSVTMVDIRPLSLPMDSLTFQKGSILEMPYKDGSLPSVSSLCVVEHIGLGRYGDPLDPLGTEKAINELKRVVQPGGDLYLSLPIHTRSRIYFNANRMLAESYFESLIAPFEIVERRYICGNTFGPSRISSPCVGCYHLTKPV